jgi:hypothetical protein
MLNVEPQLNGHHDPAELEKRRHIRKLKEETKLTFRLWLGILFGCIGTILFLSFIVWLLS